MRKRKRVRYAVVGLGHIAQAAVLPAFAHAENSELTAIVSDDQQKRRELAEKYQVERAIDYDDLEDLFERGDVDAVYIALPNHMHHEYVIRAASAGIHVLCEKPLGTSSRECEEMIAATDAAGVKLMTAYRLHFEKANLSAVEIAKSGDLGELRLFNSVFNMQVKDDNVRLEREAGGGTLFDIGIYCINAARYLFQDEPTAVQAWSVSGDDPRFSEVDEATSAVLHFPGERLATFTCSFGAASVGHYQLIGTKGELRVDPAFEYAGALKHYLTIDGKTKTRSFRARDQFAPELIYFSKCVLRKKTPEPSGVEGLADVRVIEALYQSAKSRERVSLPEFEKRERPSLAQEIARPKVKEPELVNVSGPSEDS
jgi:predicted dehydrogenase